MMSRQNPIQLLVVDDDPPVRSLVRQTLLSAGYACREAADGREAMEILAEQPVDVLISDIQMPVMDGIQLTQNIKKALRLRCDHDDGVCRGLYL